MVPSAIRRGVNRIGVPPHARRWSVDARVQMVGVTGSSARAEMVPPEAYLLGARRRFLRTRGDGPRWPAGQRLVCQVPPHARRWSVDLERNQITGRGSSARAEMVRLGDGVGSASQRFLRTRAARASVVDTKSRCSVRRCLSFSNAQGVPVDTLFVSLRTTALNTSPRGTI